MRPRSLSQGGEASEVLKRSIQRLSHLSAIRESLGQKVTQTRPLYPRVSHFGPRSLPDSDYARANLETGNHTQRLSISWHETYFLGKAKHRPMWLLYYLRTEYVASGKLLWHVYGFKIQCILLQVAWKGLYLISEASIRSDLLFDDADGIDSLPNQAIFDAIQLMGYEGDLTVLTFNKALFSPQWRFLFHTMNHCISSKSTSWDQIPTNIATAGKHFSRKVTPLFASMLVQPTEDECAHHKDHPKTITYTLFLLTQSSGGNEEYQSSSDKSLSGMEGWDMILQSVYELSVSLKKRLAGKKSKESVSKQGMKSAKVEPSVHKDPLFDELPDDTMDYMDTEDTQDVGRTRDVVNGEKETADDKVSTEDELTQYEDTKEDQTEGRSATPTTPTTTPTLMIQKIKVKKKLKRKIVDTESEDEADRLLALRLQMRREKFTVDEKTEKVPFMDTIAAQRRISSKTKSDCK
ncbi:hypothetical protein Tco_0819356 [Tanacetum coccineum]|uniref:Uncharacterized protein n=1 Tax=Tanacetum coccineum TaxID=301880 RepID=A0ABQ5A8Y1_9ASTR